MKRKDYKFNRRLIFVLFVIGLIIISLIIRLAYLQIVKGRELKTSALEQWSRSIDIKSERGIIYDRKGKKLAVNTNGYSVWAYPDSIEDPLEDALNLSQFLDLDEEDVYEKLTSKNGSEKLKSWIEKDKGEELKKLKINGIKLEEEERRYYPNSNLASHILGFTNIDNEGLDGVEKTFNKELAGESGKWLKMTDAFGRQLPYERDKKYEPREGLSLVLSLDKSIQSFADQAAEKALLEHGAKNISVIVMDPNNGDILAMVNKPDYDSNNPREPRNKDLKHKWANYSEKELEAAWYEQWRNFSVNDIYEPGSTFKLITAAAALEEGKTNLGTYYHCDGAIKDIPGVTLRCANNAVHGDLDLESALSKSCNVSFVNIGRSLGKEKLYKYSKAFGFGEKTYIDLLGEESGILADIEDIKDVHLATMSYGHGIGVTPIQLTTAVSSIVNGGKLLKPNIVKKLIDNEGNIVKEYEKEVVRQVISYDTSRKMLDLMENVVFEGLGSQAQVPGYRIGGKTGTSEKIVDNVYGEGKYIASFVGVAPIENPQLVVLTIVDEPEYGRHYGGVAAAPIAKDIFESCFEYLNIEPSFEEEVEDEEFLDLPSLIGKDLEEAAKLLTSLGFRYTTEEMNTSKKYIVKSQEPEAKSFIKKGSIINLKLEERNKENKVIPYLIGKSRKEIVSILDELKINYIFDGEGNIAIDQSIGSGEIYKEDEDMELIIKME